MPTVTQQRDPVISRYKQIEADLRRRIAAGEWAPGTMIPSRRVLSQEYAVELPTMQRAIAALLGEHILRADGGRGTFVNKAEAPGSYAAPTLNLVRQHVPVATPPHLTATIGISAYIPDHIFENRWAEDHWSSIVLRSIERYFAGIDGLTLRFQNRAASGSNQRYRKLSYDGLDAMIHIFPEKGEDLESLLAVSRELSSLTVFVSEHTVEESMHSVSFDWRNGGYQAAMHLINRGYRRITYFAPIATEWSVERLAGIRDAAKQADREVEVVHEAPVDFAFKKPDFEQVAIGFNSAWRIFQGGFFPDGVVAANDNQAIGFMDAADSAGLAAGVDYGIVGFDDLANCRSRGLTSLHPPLDSMAQAAASLILQACRGEFVPSQIKCSYHLVPRDSSRTLARNIGYRR